MMRPQGVDGVLVTRLRHETRSERNRRNRSAVIRGIIRVKIRKFHFISCINFPVRDLRLNALKL